MALVCYIIFYLKKKRFTATSTCGESAEVQQEIRLFRQFTYPIIFIMCSNFVPKYGRKHCARACCNQDASQEGTHLPPVVSRCLFVCRRQLLCAKRYTPLVFTPSWHIRSGFLHDVESPGPSTVRGAPTLVQPSTPQATCKIA